VIISESELREIISEILGSSDTGLGASGLLKKVWKGITGKSDEDATEEISGNFKADIPPGTSIAFPIGVMDGFGFRLTSKAGPRKAPKSGASKLHKGRDYGAKRGTPIVAFADGTVKAAKMGGKAGKYMEVTHGLNWTDGDKSGSVSTQYMHLNKFLKKPGETVKAGEVIALSGNTGNSTGPHLHFTFKIGGKQTANDALYADQLDKATKVKVSKIQPPGPGDVKLKPGEEMSQSQASGQAYFDDDDSQ
jgi:murein DD-endopeptidase MepM/ murein hydrolase activator NlpD